MSIEFKQESITDVSGLGIYSYPLGAIDELHTFLRDNSLAMTEDCFISFCRSIKVPANFYRNQSTEVKPKLLDNQKKFLTEFSTVLFVRENDDLLYAGVRLPAFNENILSDFTELPDFLNYRFSLDGINFKTGYYRLFIYLAEEGAPVAGWKPCYILDIPVLRNKPILCYDGYLNTLTLACVSLFNKEVTHVFDVSKKYSDRVNTFKTLLSLKEFFTATGYVGLLLTKEVVFDILLLELKKGKFLSKSLYTSIMSWVEDPKVDASVPIKEVVNGLHALEVIVYFIDQHLAINKRNTAKRKLMQGLTKITGA